MASKLHTTDKLDYYVSKLTAMNEMRNEGRFTDVKLIVAGREINAHKCVLVASSEYFKSLFQGSFQEANKTSIDLSHVAEDCDLLDSIVSYMYTGQIIMGSENVCKVVRLADYFLIDALRNLGLEFISGNMNLETCLTYYFLCQGRGFGELQNRSWEMIKSRFHDFLIFHEETLNLAAEDVRLLISRDVPKFCTLESILGFVSQWLDRNSDVDYLEVATELINYANKMRGAVCKGTMLQTSQELKDKLSLQLNSEGLLEEIRDMLQKLLALVSELREQCCNSPDLCAIPAPVDEQSPEYTERALVVFSPIYTSRRRHFPTSDPIFDLCIYRPKLRAWFSLGRLYNSDNWPRAIYTLTNDEDIFEIASCRNKLLLAESFYEDNLISYNLVDNLWEQTSFVEFYQVRVEIPNSLQESFHLRLLTYHGMKFFLSSIKVYSEDDLGHDNQLQLYFVCVKMTDDNRFERFFNTPLLDIDDGGEYYLASVSEATGELLIACHIPGNDIAYAINMDDPGQTVTRLNVPDDTSFKDAVVLERDSCFYIFNTADPTKAVKYNFDTRSLQSVSCERNKSISFSSKASELGLVTNRDNYPCLATYHVNDLASLWTITGDLTCVSQASELREITVGDCGLLTTSVHIPPPFPYVTLASAIELNKTVIEKLVHLDKYIHSESPPSRPPTTIQRNGFIFNYSHH